MANLDIKYVVFGKSNRVVDAYVAPYIQPVKSDSSINDIHLMTNALKVKSGFEWKVVLRDVDTNNNFMPVNIDDDYDRELPVLSMELYQYTKTMTCMLRDGKLPAYNRDLIDGKTPALVYAMVLTCNKEYQVVTSVDIYVALSEACAEYYGDYNNLPWGIKRSISSHTQQLHIRLCDNCELSYIRCMTAAKINDIRITPIMDCVDVETTMQETSKFVNIVAAKFAKHVVGGADCTRDTSPMGQRLGSI